MTHDSSPEERRITLRLLSYWEKKRGSAPMPTEAQVDPADIADLWEYCFMAHTKDIGKKGYHFTYLGKAIEDVYHDGLEHAMDKGPAFPELEKLGEAYRHVMEKREPLVTEGEVENAHGYIFKYRQVLLPLGDEGKVKAIFGGMRFLKIVSYK